MRSHAASRITIGLALVVLAAGCSAPAPVGEPPSEGSPAPTAASVTPLTGNVLVSTPGNRIAEFMVAHDPHDADHLVTAYGDYDSPGGMLNCAFSVSFDGGASWQVSDPVPGFSGPYLQFDGWVGFDPWGGVHATCLRQAGPGATTEAWPYYFRSTDGGLTWSAAQHIPTDPPGRSTDKSVLGVGRDGVVYGAVSGIVGWTADNGTTWEPMRPVEPGLSQFNGFVSDNVGTMFLLGIRGGDVIVQRTNDRGTTWNATVAGPFDGAPGYNDQNRWVDQRPWDTLPVLGHDPVSDDLAVAVMSWDASVSAYRSYLYRSSDHGLSFQAIEFPDFPMDGCPAPCHVTHPSIGFDLDGRIALLVQLTNEGGHVKEVYFTASGNWQEWTEPMLLSRTEDLSGWTNPQTFLPSPNNAMGIAGGLAGDPTTVHNVAAGVALTTAVSELQMRWNGEYWDVGVSTQGFVAMWIEHGPDGRPQLWSRVLKVE